VTDPIKFTAAVAKVQSLADGGLRVTLDLPEDAIMQAAQLMECKRWGAVLEVTAEPKEQESLTDLDDETEKKPERIGTDLDSRRRAIGRNKRPGG